MPSVPPATFPGAPDGYNCRLSVAGYGSYYVQVERIDAGLSIIATEDESRDRRALYVMRRSSGSFSISLVWRDGAEQGKFNAWIRRYGQRQSTPGYPISPMRVQVPVRGWDKTAIPASERGPVAEYGEAVGELAKRATLNFVGARDPLDLSEQLGDAVSFYVGPQAAEAIDARYFYPSGAQLSGSEYGQSVNFDIEAERAVARAQSQAEPPRGGARWGTALARRGD